MPYKILAYKDGSYSVKNLQTGKLVSKKTTAENAYKQVRLLNAIEKGFRPFNR